MKKRKVLIIFSIAIIAITIVLLIVFISPDKVENIYLTNFEGTTLELGEYKVKSYKKDEYANRKDIIEFVVEDVNDFYNTMIKSNQFYVNELEFVVDDYYSYGYFIKNKSLFNYQIYSNHIHLEACFGICGIRDTSKDGYYYDNYYLSGPVSFSIAAERFDTYHTPLTFEQFKKICTYLDEVGCKIEENEIFFKGLDLTDKKTYTDDYIVIFYKNGNEIKMKNYNEQNN